MLQTELAALAPHLEEAPSAKAPSTAAAKSSAATASHGYEPDGDDATTTARKKQPPTTVAPPSATTSPSPTTFKTPLNTQSRESAASAAPEPNTAADAFDPAKWPEVSCDALPPECWRPAQGCVRAVPRWPYDSPQARKLMGEGKPVILTRAPLTASAADKWNLDYLVRNLGELPCTVFKSTSSNFRYWDEAKLHDGEEMPPQTARLSMQAADFAAAVRAPAAGEKHYMQTPLVEGVAAVRAPCVWSLLCGNA